MWSPLFCLKTDCWNYAGGSVKICTRVCVRACVCVSSLLLFPPSLCFRQQLPCVGQWWVRWVIYKSGTWKVTYCILPAHKLQVILPFLIPLIWATYPHSLGFPSLWTSHLLLLPPSSSASAAHSSFLPVHVLLHLPASLIPLENSKLSGNVEALFPLIIVVSSFHTPM